MNTIRNLRADEIECRPQQVKKSKNGSVGAILLLYKDARCDMNILDESYGPMGWRRQHEIIGGNLFCTVSVYDRESGQWIDKQDVGVESNTEKEKGQASDAFKRACVNFGIGRELYTAPFIYVILNADEYYEDRSGNIKTNSNLKFTVAKISYTDNRISELEIQDSKRNVRYSMNKPVFTAQPARNAEKPPAREPSPPAQTGLTCAECGATITKAEGDYSLKYFSRPLCRNCQRKEKGASA